MPTNDIQLHLTIAEAQADPEHLDRLTRRVMGDLRELSAESVERVAGEAGGELALKVTSAFLPQLVEFLQDLARCEEHCTVTITTPAGSDVEFPFNTRFSSDEVVALTVALVAESSPFYTE